MPISTEPKLRADFFRYSKRAMSSSGPSRSRKGAQRARPLRKAEDEVFLQPLEAQRPLLHVRQPLEVEIAAGDDADDRLALDSLREKSFNASIASAPAGSSTTPSMLSISIMVAHSRFSGISLTSVGGNPSACRKFSRPISATAAPSTKLSTLASFARRLLGEAEPQAGRAGRLAKTKRGPRPCSRKYCVTPADSPPPPTGRITMSGVRAPGICSAIS
jgi:hypothetical protein